MFIKKKFPFYRRHIVIYKMETSFYYDNARGKSNFDPGIIMVPYLL